MVAQPLVDPPMVNPNLPDPPSPGKPTYAMGLLPILPTIYWTIDVWMQMCESDMDHSSFLFYRNSAKKIRSFTLDF